MSPFLHVGGSRTRPGIVVVGRSCSVLYILASTSVPDPNPDQHVFGPSGSICQRHGSGSFYHQAKIVRKTSIPTVLRLLFDFLSLKNDVNVPSKSNKQKNFFKISFLLASWRSMTKIAGSGSIQSEAWIRGSRSTPKKKKNVMETEHWLPQ